jgi:hypothetical protein
MFWYLVHRMTSTVLPTSSSEFLTFGTGGFVQQPDTCGTSTGVEGVFGGDQTEMRTAAIVDCAGVSAWPYNKEQSFTG